VHPVGNSRKLKWREPNSERYPERLGRLPGLVRGLKDVWEFLWPFLVESFFSLQSRCTVSAERAECMKSIPRCLAGVDAPVISFAVQVKRGGVSWGLLAAAIPLGGVFFWQACLSHHQLADLDLSPGSQFRVSARELDFPLSLSAFFVCAQNTKHYGQI